MKPGGRYCTELCIKKISCTFWKCVQMELWVLEVFFFFSSRNIKYNYLRRLISGLQESLVNEGFGFAGFLLVEVLLYKAFLFCRWNRRCWLSPGAWVLQRAAPSPSLEALRWADRAVKFSAGPRHLSWERRWQAWGHLPFVSSGSVRPTPAFDAGLRCVFLAERGLWNMPVN